MVLTFSIVAMCASINQYQSKYASCFRNQTSGKELVSDFAAMFEECMKQHLDERKAMPGHVIFYRDGVGEGMYDRVCFHETHYSLNDISF
jgi:hypothetical protein